MIIKTDIFMENLNICYDKWNNTLAKKSIATVMVTIMLKTITKATTTTIKVTAAATRTTGATILAAKKIL